MSEQVSLWEQYKSGNYDEVIGIWESNQPINDDWSIRAVMYSYYKLKRFDNCIVVYKKYHEHFPESNALDNILGWSLYHTSIKTFDFKRGNVNTLIKQVDYVLNHSGSDERSPRWAVVKFIIKAMNNNNNGFARDNERLSQYLDFVNPDILSAEEQFFTDKSGETRKLASERETWYSEKTKCLLSLQKYDECIQCCNKALRSLTIFHNNNDSWFTYRKAKCLYAKGQITEAKAYFEKILAAGIKQGCLFQSMFEIERDTGHVDSALSYAAACATSDPEHQMRVSFYPEFADYLDTQGYSNEAMLHRKLVILLRNGNSWRISAEQAAWQFTPDVDKLTKEDVLKKLTPFWRELRDKNKVFLTGEIEKLLAEGNSGFISAEDGKSYYFNARDIRGKNMEPKVGTKVRFTIVKKLDRSKGVVKPSAAEITIL